MQKSRAYWALRVEALWCGSRVLMMMFLEDMIGAGEGGGCWQGG